MTTRYGRRPAGHIERLATFPASDHSFQAGRAGMGPLPGTGTFRPLGHVPAGSAHRDRLAFGVPHDPRPEIVGERDSQLGFRGARIDRVDSMALGRPWFGGIVYTGSAEKVAYFIETASRERLPIVFVQDVSGFMVGPEAEHSGIIRAGARFVEAMATAVVPKIVLTINHASGAGYYAMAGQGFDPDFIFSWPTGRMGVMDGESAVMAVHGAELEKARREGREPSAEAKASMESMRADYEQQLDARFAAARGYVDAIVTPEETRDQLAFALRISANYAGPHLGPFVLPPLDAAPAL